MVENNCQCVLSISIPTRWKTGRRFARPRNNPKSNGLDDETQSMTALNHHLQVCRGTINSSTPR